MRISTNIKQLFINFSYLIYLSIVMIILKRHSYLGVALSTIGTNVCLYVLGLLMFWDVVKQRLLICEAFVA